jgi:hypothetical protein
MSWLPYIYLVVILGFSIAGIVCVYNKNCRASYFANWLDVGGVAVFWILWLIFLSEHFGKTKVFADIVFIAYLTYNAILTVYLNKHRNNWIKVSVYISRVIVSCLILLLLILNLMGIVLAKKGDNPLLSLVYFGSILLFCHSLVEVSKENFEYYENGNFLNEKEETCNTSCNCSKEPIKPTTSEPYKMMPLPKELL